MKFFSLLTIAAAAIAEIVPEPEQVPFDALHPQIQAQYVIIEYPDRAPSDSVPLVNSEPITLNYTIGSLGEGIQLIGVGGSFKDPNTQEVISNLTASRVGPHDLSPDRTVNIHQQVVPNLEPATYIMSPELFVVHDGEVLQYKTRPQLVTIENKPISLLDPQLLGLELFFLAAVGVGGWFVLGLLKAPTAKPKVVESKQFDKSWIPEAHIKRKTKKAD